MLASTVLGAVLLLTPPQPQAVQAEQALREAWDKAEERRWSPLPQDGPLQYYAEQIFRTRWRVASILEAQRLGLPADQTPDASGIDTAEVNGRPVAWIRGQETIWFTQSANTVMAAYGHAFWGDHLRQHSWVPKADALINLWAAGPPEANTFLPASRTFQVTKNRHDLAASALWALKRLDLKAQSPTPDLLPKIIVQASEPTTNPVQALLQSELAQSPHCPTELRPKLGALLDTYQWPTPASLHNTDLIHLVWALASEQRRKPAPATESRLHSAAVALANLQNNADDPAYPSNPVFGGFRLYGALVGNDTPLAAIALCEAGATLKNPHLFDRGVAGLRAALGMLRTGFNLTFPPVQPADFVVLARHDFGKEGEDLFTLHQSFEADEGKIVAAAAYLTHRFGALYEVAPGQWVGVDAVRVGPNGPVDLMRNVRKPFTRTLAYRQEVTAKGERKDLRPLLRRPTITDVQLVSVDPEPVVRVYTGASVTGAEVFQSQDPLTIIIRHQNNVSTAAPDQTGFSTALPATAFLTPLNITLSYGQLTSTRTADIVLTPDFAPTNQGPRGWTGYGQLNRPDRTRVTTCPDGQDRIGMLQSPAFFGQNRILALTLQGEGEARAQLVDDETGQTIAEFQPDPEPTAIEWDLALLGAGRRLRLRLLDPTPKAYIEAQSITLQQPLAGNRR